MSIDATKMKTTQLGAETEKTNPAADKKLGKEDFLQLLVTQLRYQDPTDPMSNEQFIAQTAQFSALEQMQVLNENVKSLIELQKSSSKTAALNLIGKQVMAENSNFTLSGGSPVKLGYSLYEDAEVAITILDADGDSVRTVNLGKQSAGIHSYTWNGMDDKALRAQSGDYSYRVSARDADGNDVEASGTVSGVVDGLAFEGDQLYAYIEGSRVPLSAVIAVSQIAEGDGR